MVCDDGCDLLSTLGDYEPQCCFMWFGRLGGLDEDRQVPPSHARSVDAFADLI